MLEGRLVPPRFDPDLIPALLIHVPNAMIGNVCINYATIMELFKPYEPKERKLVHLHCSFSHPNASKASGMKIQLCTVEVPQSAPAIINIQSPT